MISAALIALVGVLTTQIVVLHLKKRERQNAQLQALANLFDATADCLNEIREKLASYEVPDGMGTRLKAHFYSYEGQLDQEDVDLVVKAAIRTSTRKMRDLLTEGEFEDEVLRGKIPRDDLARRERMLLDLRRCTEHLRGQADVVRAKVA